MNQKYFIRLTEEERSQLKRLISSGTAPARKDRRAHILLKSYCGDLTAARPMYDGCLLSDWHLACLIGREIKKVAVTLGK